MKRREQVDMGGLTELALGFLSRKICKAPETNFWEAAESET